MHTTFLTEEQQCVFGTFRSSDRSPVERIFPLIKTISISNHAPPCVLVRQTVAGSRRDFWHESVSPSSWPFLGSSQRLGQGRRVSSRDRPASCRPIEENWAGPPPYLEA